MNLFLSVLFSDARYSQKEVFERDHTLVLGTTSLDYKYLYIILTVSSLLGH
jgi:hypothetical protein